MPILFHIRLNRSKNIKNIEKISPKFPSSISPKMAETLEISHNIISIVGFQLTIKTLHYFGQIERIIWWRLKILFSFFDILPPLRDIF